MQSAAYLYIQALTFTVIKFCLFQSERLCARNWERISCSPLWTCVHWALCGASVHHRDDVMKGCCRAVPVSELDVWSDVTLNCWTKTRTERPSSCCDRPCVRCILMVLQHPKKDMQRWCQIVMSHFGAVVISFLVSLHLNPPQIFPFWLNYTCFLVTQMSWLCFAGMWTVLPAWRCVPRICGAVQPDWRASSTVCLWQQCAAAADNPQTSLWTLFAMKTPPAEIRKHRALLSTITRPIISKHFKSIPTSA